MYFYSLEKLLPFSFKVGNYGSFVLKSPVYKDHVLGFY